MTLHRTVVEAFPIADDLEIHVSTVFALESEAVDIRNFIPSSGTYGRGVMIPHAHVKVLRAALGKV